MFDGPPYAEFNKSEREKINYIPCSLIGTTYKVRYDEVVNLAYSDLDNSHLLCGLVRDPLAGLVVCFYIELSSEHNGEVDLLPSNIRLYDVKMQEIGRIGTDKRSSSGKFELLSPWTISPGNKRQGYLFFQENQSDWYKVQFDFAGDRHISIFRKDNTPCLPAKLGGR